MSSSSQDDFRFHRLVEAYQLVAEAEALAKAHETWRRINGDPAPGADLIASEDADAIDREAAMKIFGCGLSKFRQIAKENDLGETRVGRQPMYSRRRCESVRAKLARKK